MSDDAAVSSPEGPADPALNDALRALLRPLAELALANGLPFQAAQALFRQAYVDAACAVSGDTLPHRRVSKISTATGLHRREVARLLQADAPAAPPPRSLGVELFTRWLADPACRDAQGQPLALARQGEFPSFEALARSVTRDVHPRSLLDELVRLKLVAWDDEADTVRLQAQAFVPRDDRTRMLGFLADNVGDHLRAAVSNVGGEAAPHFEQAVFADELSVQSLAEVRGLIAVQWQAMLSALVPALERLIAEDAQAARVQNQRLRIGLYGYHAPTPAGSAPSAPHPDDPQGAAAPSLPLVHKKPARRVRKD
ncbi:MAG: DUF6502 family protein [Pseudomonadota bacterium]